MCLYTVKKQKLKIPQEAGAQLHRTYSQHCFLYHNMTVHLTLYSCVFMYFHECK